MGITNISWVNHGNTKYCSIIYFKVHTTISKAQLFNPLKADPHPRQKWKISLSKLLYIHICQNRIFIS